MSSNVVHGVVDQKLECNLAWP